MGVNGRRQCTATGATLILPKTEKESGWLKSHKHHKSTESMLSGGDPKS